MNNNTPQETENPMTTYLRDNSRKKSYVEVTLDAVMYETELEDTETEVDEEVETEFERTGKIGDDEVQPPNECSGVGNTCVSRLEAENVKTVAN